MLPRCAPSDALEVALAAADPAALDWLRCELEAREHPCHLTAAALMAPAPPLLPCSSGLQHQLWLLELGDGDGLQPGGQAGASEASAEGAGVRSSTKAAGAGLLVQQQQKAPLAGAHKEPAPVDSRVLQWLSSLGEQDGLQGGCQQGF